MPFSVLSSFFNAGFNEWAASNQRDWQEKMWSKQVAYNDPKNVKARLLAAGINPYSQLDSVPAGSAGQGASASGMPFQFNHPLDSLMKLAQIKNIDANTENTDSETDLNVAKLGEVLVAVEMGLISRDEARYMLKERMEAYDKRNPFDVELDNTESETLRNESETALNEAKKAETYKNVERISQLMLNDSARLDLETTRSYVENLKTMAETSNIDSQTSANEFYRQYIQPLEAYIKQNERKSSSKDANLKQVEIDSKRLDYLLRTGDARGFVSYLNFYLDSVLSALPGFIFTGKL